MKNKILGVVFLSLSVFFGSIFGQKIKEKDLAPQFQEFLNLTRYIIQEQEKDVFMKLGTNHERNVLIDAFWKIRDPTPGTPQNEFKSEHVRRFNYANKIFRRSSARAGWMTDMGEIYIILGEPTSKERFYGTLGLYPCEVWYYYGDPVKGLPPHFGLVFYQKGGVGEFKLYDPFVDSPKELIVHNKGFAIEDFESMYARIRELAPTLSLVVLSMVPGDIPYNYHPSPQNTIMMANIFESPKKSVNTSYATNFLDYKGMVSTEYMTNFIESDTYLALIKDPLMGINFVHFSIVPRSISIDYFEPRDQYFCNYKVNVSLRQDENIIFQYSRDYPFYFVEEELQRIRGNGLAIEDSFPAISGRYKFIALLQNSVGKEFSIFEKEIVVPEESNSPHILNPIVGYQFQDFSRDLHIPFKILDKKVVIDPSQTFSSAESVALIFNLENVTQSIWSAGNVRVEVNGMKPNDPVQKAYNFRLSNFPFRKHLTVTHTIPPTDLIPDYYDIKLTFLDGNGGIIDKASANFVISPEEVVFHPLARSKAFPMANNFMYFYMLAYQYGKINDLENAEASYQRAYESRPDYHNGLIEYANFLFKVKKYNKSMELIEGIQSIENLKFQYYLLKGKAFMGLEQYENAIDHLIEGNKIYDSDVILLNALGYCYYKTGETEEALNVLRASITLNSGQEEIKQLITEIEKDTR